MSSQASFVETPGRNFGYSLFPKGATDKHPKARQTSWEALVQHFQRTWIPCEVLPDDDPKKGLPGFSLATFRPRTTRARQNVLNLDGLMIDVDNSLEVETGEYHLGRDGKPSNRPKLMKVCLPDPVYPESVIAALTEVGVAACIHTTWSHSVGWPRFRVAVGFENSVPAELWSQATEYALEHLRLRPLQRAIDLPVLRDTARMHFLPGAPNPTSVQRWHLGGRHLPVPLHMLAPIEVPDLPRRPWQEAIVRERGKERNWCRRIKVGQHPADFRSLDLAAMLQAMGVTVGQPRQYGDGVKWRTHCPWASEHTHGLDDDCGVIIHTPGHWPVWKCAHSHHSHLGLRDLLEAFGGLL